jgi:hypothetical protein
MSNGLPVNFNPGSFYTPLDWYWTATDGSGRVYSSARNAPITSFDGAYQAFLGIVRGPTAWPTDANGNQSTAALQAVMSQ